MCIHNKPAKFYGQNSFKKKKRKKKQSSHRGETEETK